MADGCKHMTFDAHVAVARLEGDAGLTFVAEIRIKCLECDKAFQFLGLQPGLDLQGARVSLDGLEANLAIVAQGERPSPIQMLGYNIGKFDG